MIKKFNIYFLSILIFVLLSSCGAVKKGFSSQKKNNSDEFLVEKKSPLSMPPDYNELPVPKSESILDNDQKDEIKELITKSKNANTNQDSSDDSIGSVEEIILGKIKNN